VRRGTYDEIVKQSQAWRRNSKDLDFLGEIALTQEEVESFLSSIGPYHRRFAEPDLAFALAVGAVNWAYWRGVEEEDFSGFRESFMAHTSGDVDFREWDYVWGPAIEESICSWSGEPPRSGAYRYVGLVLRHAGVPHTKMSRFAELLKRVDEEIGWWDVQTLQDRRLEEFVLSYFTGCIADHLISQAGLAYIRSLCGDLANVRVGAGSMTNLPGYRPGLISTLLQFLNLKQTIRQIGPSFKEPFVRMDFPTGQLALIFDERSIRSGHAIECHQWSRRLYDSELEIGPGSIPPFSLYTGRMPNGRTWSARGWCFEDENCWALFRVDGRIAACRNHADTVTPGDYVLASRATPSFISQRDEAIDEGERYLPDGTEFHLWRICIRDGDDGKLPDLRVDSAQAPWMECINWGPLTRWTSLEAVCLEAPRIRIHGWTTRNRRRYRLFLAAGGKVQDISVDPSESGASTTFSLGSLAEGKEVELTLQPIGFQQGLRASQTLRIMRFNGMVSISDGIWGIDEPAEMRLTATAGISLLSDTGVALRRGGANYTVVVPRRKRAVSLTLRNDRAAITLRVPVRRASICLRDAPGEPCLLDKATIRRLHDDGNGALTISAAPGVAVDLVAKDRLGNLRTWRSSVRLGANGAIDFKAADLVDIVRSETGILEFLLVCGSHAVSTGSYFVEPDADDIQVDTWPEPIASYVGLLRSPATDPELILQKVSATCLFDPACAVLTADIALGLSSTSRVVPRPPGKVDAWISQWRELVSERPIANGPRVTAWKMAVTDWIKSCPISFSPVRWGRAVQAFLGDVDRKIDISGPVSNLLQGIQDNTNPDGLVHGWQLYIRATSPPEDLSLILRAGHFLANASNGVLPWSEVAKRLHAWTFLRAGAVSNYLDIQDALEPADGCNELDAQLARTSALFRMELPLTPTSGTAGFGLVPISADQSLVRALAGDCEHWKRAAESDWLAAWLAWRWAVIMRQDSATVAEFQQGVRRVRDSVPIRAEDLIAADLREGTPMSVRPVRSRC
jgi:hypothetical protein